MEDIERKNKLKFEISHSVNNWHEQIISDLEGKYSESLESFLNNKIRITHLSEINKSLEEKIGLTLEFIHPRLLTKNNSLISLHNDFSQLELSTFFLSKLSKFLRIDLTFEEELFFYKSEFEAYITRHYFLGKLDWELSVFLHVYINGFDCLKPHLSNDKWKYLIDELEKYNNGIYGIQNRPWTVKFNSTYSNFEKKDCTVWLAGFEDKSSPTMNFYYGPLTFFKFDNLDLTDFLIDKNLLTDYFNTYNSSENGIRKLRRLPLVGEGWISETKLFYLIKKQFGSQTTVLHHGKPKWLGRQHFDIYLPEFNLAIEYQGEQHYKPIDFFGGQVSFEENKLRDERKKKLAVANNCHLICIDKGFIENEIVQEIEFYILKKNS